MEAVLATITKAQMVQAISSLPENATIEDAMERLLFLSKIEQGLLEVRTGPGIPHEEMMQWMEAQIANGWQS